MKRANKHQAQMVSFSHLNGGINLAMSPDQIAENEMQDCVNFIYDGTRLVGRGGTRRLYGFGSPVKSMFYDYDVGYLYVFLNNKTCYRIIDYNNISEKNKIGNVLGDNKAHCKRFQNKIFIATGEYLQYIDDNTIKTITTSPYMDKLFFRWSRLGGYKIGSDRLHYSAVGDAIGNSSFNAWQQDTNDPSTYRWLDVGYGDSGDIVCVVFLATDVIVFKTNGIAYQVTGDADFNSVSVVTISNNTDISDDFKHGDMATNIGNEVVFLSMRGLRTMSATQDYGNISTGDIGDKFNKLIVEHQYEPELWNLRRNKTIIIRATSSHNDFIAYNYNLGVATKLHFPMEINWFEEGRDEIFIGANTGLYLWDAKELTDSGTPVDYKLVPRDIISTDEILVKSIDTSLECDHSGTMNVAIGERLKVDMPSNRRRKIRCNHSCDVVHLELTGNERVYVNHINLETVGL